MQYPLADRRDRVTSDRKGRQECLPFCFSYEIVPDIPVRHPKLLLNHCDNGGIKLG